MTNLSSMNVPNGDEALFSPGAGEKIIQRILRPELSDGVKATRLADDDSELVSKSQHGDAVAFEALVRLHQHMVHALTYRMTGSLADAEDLAQETFLRAYEQIESFRGGAKFSTWLCRIAINACLNWRQRESRRRELDTQAAEELSLRQAGDGGASSDQAAQVQAALLKLPGKQRAAIVLTVYDGLNHAEAAQVLGCSETTVSWRVFAAKRKLKRWLTAGGAAPRRPLGGQETRAENAAPRQHE
jgi:RNA polymerase sigma-70 factor (ECF subfamily)